MHRNDIWKAIKLKTEYLTFNVNIGLPSPSDSPLFRHMFRDVSFHRCFASFACGVLRFSRMFHDVSRVGRTIVAPPPLIVHDVGGGWRGSL